MSEVYNFQQQLLKYDFKAAVDFGLVKGLASDSKFGHCPDAGAIQTDVWELGLIAPEYIWPVETGETTLLRSDNAADDGILIDVLIVNEQGFEEIVQYPCGTVATPTAIPEKIRACNRLSNASGTISQGLVTIRGDGTDSVNVFGALSPDDQQSSQAMYLVPIDKVVRINNFSNAINRSGGATVNSIDRLAIQLPGGVFRTQIRYGLNKTGTSNLSSDLIVGIPLPPLTKIKISAEPDAAGTDVSAEWSMNIYDVDLLGSNVVNKLRVQWGLDPI